MIKQVQEALSVLVGMKEVGDYALHVQCAWRITRHDVVVAASGDIHTESSGQSNGDSSLTLTPLDERVQELFQDDTRPFVVEQVEAGHAGAFSVTLTDGYTLDVMPDDSSDSEHWRLFRPYVEGPHFVVTGAGLET